ncbi:hypothetical protein V6U78_06735 [Marinospirillum sp. MEB164]|uniref:Uncharacterized protein n=1 Tax=Marinospirillum alkalitolerans TaxID=3123374 RepID=A0ABW8PXL6_9GAMM
MAFSQFGISKLDVSHLLAGCFVESREVLKMLLIGLLVFMMVMGAIWTILSWSEKL